MRNGTKRRARKVEIQREREREKKRKKERKNRRRTKKRNEKNSPRDPERVKQPQQRRAPAPFVVQPRRRGHLAERRPRVRRREDRRDVLLADCADERARRDGHARHFLYCSTFCSSFSTGRGGCESGAERAERAAGREKTGGGRRRGEEEEEEAALLPLLLLLLLLFLFALAFWFSFDESAETRASASLRRASTVAATVCGVESGSGGGGREKVE